ncbi:hypothetical protein RHGRI_033649 [Rhododendron griersonianum]|uniref:UDP-galactose transporter 3 n=1 Tax=Rhododendron griersonianum TaxID=479676 RepID=A0AAV6I348_9ERIC|nr:hypothetical protein RHGRI_033649 [Rhododendron griersonianum]
MESHGAGLRRVLVLAFCVAGIWSAYIYQGVLQETVSTKRFGPDNLRFEHLAFLNLAQSVVCLMWSFIMIKLWSSSSNGGAPWWSYWSAGITNTIGPAMGIEALKYISYPAQVKKHVCCSLCAACNSYPRLLEICFILKLKSPARGHISSKTPTDLKVSSNNIGCEFTLYAFCTLAPKKGLPPTLTYVALMLMGALVYGIRYSIPEYVCSLLVAGGVSVFALSKTSSKTISKLAHPNAPLGYGLCFLNLAFDGFTNATQDSITARYPKTSAWEIMLGMNLWGTIYNMVFMFGWPGASGYSAVQFCKQHPEAAWDIFLYCLCGAVGQNFIFLTISRFGSLTNTTITTTRKFVSIVVSSLLSGNPLSTKQWGSVFMVFSGLSYQIYLKWKKLQRFQKKRKSM